MVGKVIDNDIVNLFVIRCRPSPITFCEEELKKFIINNATTVQRIGRASTV